MARAYSGDLRERVIEAVAAGASARGAAARFGVGAATAVRWMRAWRESGGRAARRQGKPRGSKLDMHEGFLLGLIEEKVDLTLEEMRRRLADERGVSAGLGTLWRFFAARGISFKKRRAMRTSRIATTSMPHAWLGSRRSPISTPSDWSSSMKPD